MDISASQPPQMKEREKDQPAADIAGQAAPTGPRRGRRRTHTEDWTKVTVVLLDRQIAFLDRLVADVRAASGMALGRAHVIRALVNALAASDIDLTSCRSEADLVSMLTTRLASSQRSQQLR
jgi:hypothetical protein